MPFRSKAKQLFKIVITYRAKFVSIMRRGGRRGGWWCRRKVPPKRPYACTKRHGILFQMSEILTQFSSHITTNTVSPTRCVRTTCLCTCGRFYTARVHVMRSTGALGSSDSTQSRHFVEQLAKADSVWIFQASEQVGNNHCIRSTSSMEETGYSCLGKQIIVHSKNHMEHTNTRRDLVHQQSVNILCVT